MSNDIIDINEYKEILSSIKNEILKSQYRAMQVVNVEMIYMYWNIGKIISNNIKWGNKFVDNLAIDLKLEFPDITGFSPRNIRYMRKFADEYQDEKFLQEVIAKITWYHNVILMDKVKDIFTGKITNWKEVGGEDAQIVVISREEGSGTRDGFQELVGFESEELSKAVHAMIDKMM